MQFKKFIFYVFLLHSGITFSQHPLETAIKIDSLFASYNSATPGAAIAIVKDGKVVLSKGYGMADLDHGIPISSKTVFNIASVSKQFTAFSIYLLAAEGKISVEDEIKKYFPELPDFGYPIRIRHLLAHTSGLRDQAALFAIAGIRADDAMTTEQILKLMARQKKLNFQPGTVFGYSNTGYTLLAEIIERVTGKTFANYTQEKIFQPLGMVNTHFSDNHQDIVKNRAKSYERIDGKLYQKSLTVSNPGPSSLMTTVEDLAKWVMNFENPKVGTDELISSFNESSFTDDGKKTILRILGPGDTIFHAKGQNLSTYKGLSMITHGGHTAGFRTFLGRFPGQRLSIIVLSNDEHNERLNARWQIADFYIKDQFSEKNEEVPFVPPASRRAENKMFKADIQYFQGEFYSEEVATGYRIKLEAGKLLMEHHRLNVIELKRIDENKFSGTGPHVFPFDIEFLKNITGVVTGFSISNFGVKNLNFNKVK